MQRIFYPRNFLIFKLFYYAENCGYHRNSDIWKYILHFIMYFQCRAEFQVLHITSYVTFCMFKTTSTHTEQTVVP